MRVAHLTPAYFSDESVIGGGERYVYYLARALRTTGSIDQRVYAPGNEDKQFERDGVAVRILRNDSPLPSAMNSFSTSLWQELEGFDLVHIHQSLTLFGAYSTVIARSLRIPTVGTDLGGGENQLMLRGQGLELLDGVLSISRYAHSLVAPFYTGLHEVLIGPVDTTHFSPANVARDPKMVLCVSRILPHKGIDRVVAALPEGLRLVIAGRVYHQEYYERLKVMANGKDVQFIHDADDNALVDLYRSAGLFIQASTFRDIFGNAVAKPELMGLTTLEAMACGLPVAVSDAGSLPELITDDRFGRVFSNHEQLSALLQEMAAGTWPSAEAADLARSHVEKTHGMGPIGKRLATFYAAVTAQARGARQ